MIEPLPQESYLDFMSKHHQGKTMLPMPSSAPAVDPRLAVIAQHQKTRAEERNKRLELLKNIALERTSTVIGYVTASRGSIGAQVGADVIRLLREQLGSIGQVDKLDLVLITRGGHTLTPLRLMSLLREFAKKVNVLVPYMAHSAGTLIALGADEIVMGAMGELGPVDPSVANQFNPILDPQDIQGTAQQKPRPRIPISVEDVTSYLNFAKSRAELDPAGMAQAHSALTNQVHPLALGNILRNHNLIRHLAKTLLLMHMNPESDKDKLDAIVRKLTEELYAHDYTITRDEGVRIGLKIVKPSDQIEKDLWDLYQAYERFFGVDRQVNLAVELGAEKQKYLCFDVAVLEGENLMYSYCIKGSALRKGVAEFEFNADAQGWEN